MAEEDITVHEVVKMMVDKKIGSLIIGKNKEASGIITEQGLVTKVLYKGLNIDKTKAKDIMSFPILQMDKHLPLNEAALKMSSQIMFSI
jgi:signal-transduction protein with cAMP-binding, CBS, and nucleotidyltransferase domain|tara:strand:- start:277 stop:543 length:267 start_codon:yes stop_codon:yes gene_type:complete